MSNLLVTTLKTPDGRFLRGGVWKLGDGVSPRATIVLLQGQSEFLEKYSEVASELNARGFVVVSVDWRGQGASDRQRGIHGNRQGHVGKFEEYNLDLAVLLNQLAQPLGGPMIALAHSMGAHILLHHMQEHRRRFHCAVLTAPMIEVWTEPYSPFLTGVIATLMNIIKPSTRFVFGMEERDPIVVPFEQNRVTSDRGRYQRMQDVLKAQPFLRVFGPTFGWLGAALISMARMRAKDFAESIKTPLLVFGAGRDRIIKVEAVREFVKRLPDARYVELKDSEHEILMETDAIRARYWEAFDTFVGEQLQRPVDAPKAKGFAARKPVSGDL